MAINKITVMISAAGTRAAQQNWGRRMALVTVRVNTPANRLIYINGDYAQSAGNSSKVSFTVPTGGQFFETLNGDRCVDYRKRVRVRSDDTELRIDLEAVDPPEQI